MTKVIKQEGDYRLASKGKEVPDILWFNYVRIRSWYNEIKTEVRAYVDPPKDKRFRKERNHRDFAKEVEPIVLAPGEIAKFNQDAEDQTSEL